MKLRSSLTGKILVCALSNLVLLVGALVLFVRTQFEMGPESILMAPGEMRARYLGEAIAGELGETAPENRTALLARFERTTGVQMGLFFSNAQCAGGTVRQLPVLVSRIVRGRQADRPPGPPEHGPKMGMPPLKRQPGDPVPANQLGPPVQHPVFLAKADGAYWMGVRIPIQEPGQQFPYLGTLIIRSPTLLFNPLLFDVRPWAINAFLLLGITLACWAPLIRRLTKSIRAITGGAEHIAAGRFDVKLPIDRGDEIDQLSDALNRMSAQLDGFVHGQKRFLGAVAHELCAPLARTQLAIGILEERIDGQQSGYVECLREEVQQMSGLVNELLQFSKAGLQADQPPPVTVLVGELVQQVIDREVTTGYNVELTEGHELTVMAQREGLFRAVSNVVRNAIRYAGTDGPITIAAKPAEGNIVLVVADQGPGLPEEAIERVFAPFYRLDSSRSRASGGVGLGLAIVRACVESSGGSVYCRNRTPRGLEVCILLKSAG